MNFNTTLVSVRVGAGAVSAGAGAYFNTTLVSVRAGAQALIHICGHKFQYNSCVGSRQYKQIIQIVQDLISIQLLCRFELYVLKYKRI